jgi:hypothetical protein
MDHKRDPREDVRKIGTSICINPCTTRKLIPATGFEPEKYVYIPPTLHGHFATRHRENRQAADNSVLRGVYPEHTPSCKDVASSPTIFPPWLSIHVENFCALEQLALEYNPPENAPWMKIKRQMHHSSFFNSTASDRAQREI